MFNRIGPAVIAVLAAVILCAAACSCYAQASEEETLKNGVSLIRHDKVDEAIKEFKNVISINPQSVSAYYNLGFAYDKKGDLDKAIINFDKAIEIDPSLADAYYNRGFAYYRKGAFDKAIVDYNKVTNISPDSADAYYGLGLVYSKKGDLDKAIASYTKAIKARPNFALAYDARAVAYVSKKNYIGAMADVNKAQSLGFRSRPIKRTSASGTAGTTSNNPILPASGPDRWEPAQAFALNVAGVVFLIISIMQLIRVVFRAKIVVNDRIVVPLWLSMIASPVLFLLAICMFIAARQG